MNLTERVADAREWVGRRVRRRLSAVTAADPAVAAKSVPYAADADGYAIASSPAASGARDPGSQPVRPVDRWELLGQTDPQVYLDSGADQAQRLMTTLAAHEIELGSAPRVLDFGCGYGRLTRWLAAWAELGEVWGVDIDGERIEWARRNLGPAFHFVAVTSQPHLPFEDGTFDLVHTSSVLPHIADGAEAWMLELRRVARPGGHLVITVYDERTAEQVRAGTASPDLAGPLARAEAAHGLLGDEVDVLALSRHPAGAQVFRSRRWIERVWGAWFDIVGYEPDAFHVQSAVLLRKRP